MKKLSQKSVTVKALADGQGFMIAGPAVAYPSSKQDMPNVHYPVAWAPDLDADTAVVPSGFYLKRMQTEGLSFDKIQGVEFEDDGAPKTPKFVWYPAPSMLFPKPETYFVNLEDGLNYMYQMMSKSGLWSVFLQKAAKFFDKAMNPVPVADKMATPAVKHALKHVSMFNMDDESQNTEDDVDTLKSVLADPALAGDSDTISGDDA